MNEILCHLGVPDAVQSFFDVQDLLFSYGEHSEYYDIGCHRVPATSDLWVAGGVVVREVIITPNAMEAIAYLSLNLHRYPDIHRLLFVATGNLPHQKQLDWIRKNYRKKKFTLVYPGDLLGRLADIRVACGLSGRPVGMHYADDSIRVSSGQRRRIFQPEKLSLHVFELAFGMKSGISTSKPNFFNTYLDQLIYDANNRDIDQARDYFRLSESNTDGDA